MNTTSKHIADMLDKWVTPVNNYKSLYCIRLVTEYVNCYYNI